MHLLSYIPLNCLRKQSSTGQLSVQRCDELAPLCATILIASASAVAPMPPTHPPHTHTPHTPHPLHTHTLTHPPHTHTPHTHTPTTYSHTHHIQYIASFPGLPHLQFLIACSILQAIKNWRNGRPGNEATTYTHTPTHKTHIHTHTPHTTPAPSHLSKFTLPYG